MKFTETLEKYISEINCTASELASESGILPSSISRYRSGERVPANGSRQLASLAAGLYSIALKKGNSGVSERLIYSELSASLDKATVDFSTIVDNLNRLINMLGINVTEMAKTLNYDPSYISRIRSKQRRPSDINTFLDKVCRFIIRKYSSENSISQLSILLNCSTDDINSTQWLLKRLEDWFCVIPSVSPDNSTKNFLNILEEFNLEEYIRMIHFDTMKLPPVPFQLSAQRRYYYGIEEFKKAELDFLKSTVLSKSTMPVFMCNDMPMEEMSRDMEFGKKWMFGIAAMLKKNLYLDVIHNVDRPFNEMMLGLESWIPLYMTGQITPYYFKNPQNEVYSHAHYSSGEVALIGDAVVGCHNDGVYCLTRHKAEVAQYRKLALDLVRKALPLMVIYRSDRREEYRLFLNKDGYEQGMRININASLPLYTTDMDLLDEILCRNHISSEKKSAIHAYAAQERERFYHILENSIITDELPNITEAEFNEHPLTLPLSGLFIEDEVYYTYDEYKTQLDMIFSLSSSNENYTAMFSKRMVFRNLQIAIHKNRWVMISKSKYPAIHFVIFHPKLREAIENMVVIYAELDV